MARNKTLLLFFLFLFFISRIFGGDALEEISSEHEKLFDQVKDSVVAIESKVIGFKAASYSGLIISEDGYVLTTMDQLTSPEPKVRHPNGKTYNAKLINRDENNQLALIKIDSKDKFHPVKFGDSAKMKPGSFAMTLGNPFEVMSQRHVPVMSVGVVSERYRGRAEGNYRGPVLETDAAVNPGSYGGALINSDGEVVGLLCATISYQKWLGTAIPSEQFIPLIEKLKNPASVFMPARPDFNLREENGALVVDEVLKNGLADKAGLCAGMTVLELDYHSIQNMEEYKKEIERVPAGTELRLAVEKSGKKSLISVRIPDAPLFESPIEVWNRRGDAKLGVTGEDNAKSEGGGVTVASVEENSPAAEAGVKEGQVIFGLRAKKGGEIWQVRDMEDLISAMKVLTPKTKLLLVVREKGKTIELPMTLGSK